MSIRPFKVPVQPGTGASKTGRPGRKAERSQRPSRDDRMLWGAGTLIRKIYVEATEAQENVPKAVTIQNYESLASYSWKDTEHPTIYVPGSSLPAGVQIVGVNKTPGTPPKFTPPLLPIQLQRDSLTHSKPRSPAAAVDPLFEALLHQHPDFNMSSIQVVSDRNSLRNLLSFASKGPGKWRIDVDMIDNTMFINQWEEFRLSMIIGHQDSGFGHAFEGCITTRESGMDAIHHERIVRYELGGLECLVRFEADAYLCADGDGDGDGD
ncbi:MAG: hypothetical protein CL912_27025, partial [Deltaproteobacteria bacterium]|nr:hypothetical protein [Deltaproteobacteria bacterium]